MRRRFTALLFLIAIPLLSSSGCCWCGGCCNSCGPGYRLFWRPYMFGNCGGCGSCSSCGEAGCTSCYQGAAAGQMMTPPPPAYGPGAPMPNPPTAEKTAMANTTTIPTRIIR
ncbi:MAG: hypothetical protein ACJ8C4_17170 [Gemmataceae bacterium]